MMSRQARRLGAVLLFGLTGGAFGGESAGGDATTGDRALRTDAAYTAEMLNRQNHVTNKVARALQARQAGRLPEAGLTFGGRLVATQIFERTNTPGKFPILSRLPPSHTRGRSDSYGVINDITAQATLTLPLVTAYAQGEYTEIAYPGQEDIQLRKAWISLGDLSRSPFYLAFGRKSVNFGNFTTYAPFTHSHSSHYFWAQSEDPVVELGYVTDRTQIAVTLIPEHRGRRVISSPGNDGTWSNYAVNLSHRFDLAEGRSLTAGAGFLRGTIYDSVIAHHPPDVGVNRFWNGAWDANLTYGGPGYDLQVQFTRTQHDWPATGHHVQATTIQGRLFSEIRGRPVTWTATASRGVQGTPGTQWERMEQVILGAEIEAGRHVRLGAEYMFNRGFVPLILPRVTSDRNVESHTFLVGVNMTF